MNQPMMALNFTLLILLSVYVATKDHAAPLNISLLYRETSKDCYRGTCLDGLPVAWPTASIHCRRTNILKLSQCL